MMLQSVCMRIDDGELRGDGQDYKIEQLVDCMESSHGMDRRLLEYVVAGRDYAQQLGLRSMSLCTEKASVNGLGAGLQNTSFTLGESEVAVAPL